MPRSATSNCCPASAMSVPARLAEKPSTTNWMTNNVSICPCAAPKQRIIAAASRWRRRYRDAASATATAARITATNADRPRNFSARSSVCRISGRTSRIDSSRCPRESCGSAHARYASIASPATSKRYAARLPGCSRFVAGTSSMFISSRGPSDIRPPVTSGSCRTMAATVSVLSPRVSFAPGASARRAASRVSTQASPRPGAPVAGRPSATSGTASITAPRNGYVAPTAFTSASTASLPPGGCTILLKRITGTVASPRVAASRV